MTATDLGIVLNACEPSGLSPILWRVCTTPLFPHSLLSFPYPFSLSCPIASCTQVLYHRATPDAPFPVLLESSVGPWRALGAPQSQVFTWLSFRGSRKVTNTSDRHLQLWDMKIQIPETSRVLVFVSFSTGSLNHGVAWEATCCRSDRMCGMNNLWGGRLWCIISQNNMGHTLAKGGLFMSHKDWGTEGKERK